MRFVIRADSSAEIGAGHVMRCCAIAEELIARGQIVVFVGETESLPWVHERVSALGLSEIYANPEYFHPNPKSDVLILDSYEIDRSNSFINPARWRCIVAIVDDSTPQVDADLYIHPGSETTWIRPILEKNVRFLSGIDYIPVRRSIRTSSSGHQTSTAAKPNILVIGGGSDYLDFCGAIGGILETLSEQFFAIFFVTPNTTLPPDVRFQSVTIGAKIENFLDKADLVFTTAGTSSWELLSCGLPLGLACAVDNQIANYRFQTEGHLALGIGLNNKKGNWELDEKAIHNLVASSEIREALSKKASRVVDGKGCERIVDEILDLGSSLLPD